MASVLPSQRPHADSTGTSSSASRPRHPSSLSSFPSGMRSTSASASNSGSHLSSAPSHQSQIHPSSQFQYQSQPRRALAPAFHQNGADSRPKMVKSQYPPESTEKHVEYILVASFDIDRGSVMEHQYPNPVGGDDQMLAELMLPDGAHVRAQDWTIFFLHKDAAVEGDADIATGRQRRRRRQPYGMNGIGIGIAQADGASEEERNSLDEFEDDEYIEEDDSDEELLDHLDGPPLVYVLNLVNTKQDNTVKRGAIVKAMAICTRHPFLHIYKPLLLLALQNYFAHPVMETLAQLYDAVNAMDLSLMPRLTVYEKYILQSSDAKDLFLEKFEALIGQHMSTDANPSPQREKGGRLGLPRDTHEFESVVPYSNVPVPVKIPVALSLETVGDFSLIKLITTFSTPHSTSPVPFQPTHSHLTTGGPLTHPIIVLLNALLTQKRIVFLGHNLPSADVASAVLAACALASGGMLRGFTRHAFPYTDLTKIDDLLNVPGFIAGVTNPAFAHKNEWWDLLCDISTGRMKISTRLEQAQLTEGVAFFQNPSNHALSPGTVGANGGAGSSLSAGLTGNLTPVGDPTGDVAFMANVIQAIHERHGENAIRSKFRRWILKFTRLSSAFEETVYGATSLHIRPTHPAQPSHPSPVARASSPRTPGKNGTSNTNAFEPSPNVTSHGYVWPNNGVKTAELAANASRIEGWRMTRSYYNFIQDLAAFYSTRPVKDLDLQHLHDKLARLRLTPDQSGDIYLAIVAAVRSEAQIDQLLSVICLGTPVSVGAGASAGAVVNSTFQGQHGLFYLALGLFHPKGEVRSAVAEFLGRIQEHEAGRHFWRGLGRFARMAWERVIAGSG